MLSPGRRGFYLWYTYLQVDGYFGLNNPTREIFDAFLLLLVVLTIIMQISQLVPEQCLWLVNSKNASCVCFSLFVELSVFPVVFLSRFGAGGLFCAQSLAIEGILFGIVDVRNAAFGDDYLLLLWLQVLFWVEQMATDERWIEIVGIWSAIFVWTVKTSAHLFAIGLLVEVDSSSGGTPAHFLRGKVSLAGTFVHKLSLLLL